MFNLGVTISLRDAFTQTARGVRATYQELSHGITDLNNQLARDMYHIWNGTALMLKGVAMTMPVVFPIMEATKYEYQLKAIETIWEHANASAEVQKQKIVEMSDELKALSKEMGTDPTETAKGYYNILQANINDQELALHLLELSQKSAIAGLTTVEDASKGLVSIRNAYQLTGEQMTTTTDQLFAALAAGQMTFNEFNRSLGETIGIVKQSGLDLDEYFGLKATATLSGMTASQADTGIKQSLQELFQPKEKATIELLESLKSQGLLSSGFEWSTNYMQSVGYHNFLKEVYGAAEATGEADKVMGRLFNDMEGLAFVLSVVGEQAAQYDDVMSQIQNSTGKLEQAFKKIHESIKHKWDAFVARFKLLMIEIGTPLLKIAAVVLTFVTAIVDGLTWLFDNVPGLSYVFAGFVAVASLAFIALGFFMVAMGMAKIILTVYNSQLMTTIRGMTLFHGAHVALMAHIIPQMIILIGMSYLLYKAWTGNWGGMRDHIMGFVKDVKLVFGALKQLITSTTDGVGYMSIETADQLKKAGLLDFAVTIYMTWFRLKVAWEGFIDGMRSAWLGFERILSGFMDAFAPILVWVIPFLKDLAIHLGMLKPSEGSADDLRNMGMLIGQIVGSYFIFSAVLRVVTSLATMFRVMGKTLGFLFAPLKWVGNGLLAVFGLGGKFGARGVIADFKLLRTLIVAVAEDLYLRFLYAIDGVRFLFTRLPGIIWRGIVNAFRGLGWRIGVLLLQGLAAVLGLSVGWVVAIVVGLGAAIWFAVTHWDWVTNIAGFIGHILNEALQWLIAGLMYLTVLLTATLIKGFELLFKGIFWVLEKLFWDLPVFLGKLINDYVMYPVMAGFRNVFRFFTDSSFRAQVGQDALYFVTHLDEYIMSGLEWMGEGIANWWTSFWGGLFDWFDDFFDGIADKFTWLIDMMPDWAKESVGISVDAKKPDVAGFATGGEILGTGLAMLHPNEAVINSPTLMKLKSFLNNQDEQEFPELPEGGGDEPRYVETYTNRLAEHRETRTETTQDNSLLDQMMSGMQQMMAAVAQMQDRPIDLTVAVPLDGREIYRNQQRYKKEGDARKY
jgi:TP901 family phage tail tape measure protein